MVFYFQRTAVIAILALTPQAIYTVDALAGSPGIQFDMPAVTTALDSSVAGETREITIDLVLSSLVVGSNGHSSGQTPPIDHLLIRCSLRDRLPVVDFFPKTELQSDFASPIAITKKDEKTDSLGLNINANFHPFGTGQFGADNSRKRSDSTQFSRQAPMQAVVASGTTDRGRGVYFKLRWTTQQVLEGEKHFQVSFAVPESWRGGLVDVSVTANGWDRSLFGSSKLRSVASQHFVVAAHQQHDPQAAEISLRLAHLDQELAAFAKRNSAESNVITQLWRRVVQADSNNDLPGNWYHRITHDQADPYMDKRIRSLPMPVRVAVLGYTEATRDLMELDDTL